MVKKSSKSSKSQRTISPLAGLNVQLVSALLILMFLYTMVTLGAVFQMPLLEENSRNLVIHNGQRFALQKIADTTEDEEDSIKTSDSEQAVEESGHGNAEKIETLRQRFPTMVKDDDMEEIDHPGQMYANIGKSGPIEKLKVPKFWADSPEVNDAYGEGGVRGFLGNHGQHLMTLSEAKSVGSLWNDGKAKRETIYISVASYRDPECMPTIESILARAKYPKRIRVAVIDQRDAKHDDEFCGPPKSCDGEDSTSAYCRYKDQVDLFHVEARLSIGPVFARHLAHRMYRGEYYAMQVDSHIRFTQDWDDDLIWQWKSARNEMTVLTTYLSDIIDSIDPVTHQSKHPGRPIMCKSGYEGQGKLKHLRHGQQPEGLAGIKGQPTLEPFWAAGFSFARAHFVIQIPYDQYLPMVFQGEEISMGLRGFTYGYDYYAAERSVCFHMYAIKENKEKRKRVKLFWENSNLYRGAELEAMKRLNGIIGMGEKGEVYDHTDESKYGLGRVRSTKKFFETFGIHTDTQTIEDGLCTFVGKPMMQEIGGHLRSDTMGINYDEITYRFVDPKKKK